MPGLKITSVAAGAVVTSAVLLTSSSTASSAQADAAGSIRLCTGVGTDYAVTLTVPMRGVRTTVGAPVGTAGPNCTDVPVTGGEPVVVDTDAGSGASARHRDYAWFVARGGRRQLTFTGTADHPRGDLPETVPGAATTMRIVNAADSTFQAVVLFPARGAGSGTVSPVVPPGAVNERAVTVQVRGKELAVLYLVSTTRPADRKYLAYFEVRDVPHTLDLRGTWERPQVFLTPTTSAGG